MSKRPTIEKKKRRVIKALERTPLPAHIDLLDYIKFRTRCTTGMAYKVLFAGSLLVDGHVAGFHWEDDPKNAVRKEEDHQQVKVLDRYIPAEYRDKIEVRKLSDAELDEAATASRPKPMPVTA